MNVLFQSELAGHGGIAFFSIELPFKTASACPVFRTGRSKPDIDINGVTVSKVALISI